MGKIILASSSPRRADILKESGYSYEIIPSPYEEQHTRAVFSYDYIIEQAYNKAKAVAELLKEEKTLVIGADTMVVLDNDILEKPHSIKEACDMLKRLSGRKHRVVTAIAVIQSSTGKNVTKAVTSDVEFYALTDEQIKNYVEKFKPLDKAGAYGIQELPEGFVKSYTGSLKNIIGLCPDALSEMLEQFN